jgi:hypothetical protein
MTFAGEENRKGFGSIPRDLEMLTTWPNKSLQATAAGAPSFGPL